MNKNRTFTLLLIMLSYHMTGIGQYGIDGAVAAAVHTSLWYSTEKPSLKKIEDKQENIFRASTIIFARDRHLQEIKQEKHKALHVVGNVVEEAGLVLLVEQTAEDVYRIQEATLEAIQGNLETILVIDGLQLDLVTEAYYLINDTIIALTGGESNLLNSGQRLDLLAKTYLKLQEIRDRSVEIRKLALSMAKIETLSIRENPELTINLENYN